MTDMTSAMRRVSDLSDQAIGICNKLYDDRFAKHFSESRALFERLSSKEYPITNDELQWILLDLPIHLFDVSEELNNLRVEHELAKISIRDAEREVADREDVAAMKVADRKEFIALETAWNRMIAILYASVIERVEREISFSRELIMGAKKVWDSRFKTDSVNPVSEHTPESNYPEYSKTYIHGA